MASFEIAVQETLKHEGGYVDSAADPGGATNMGVRQDDLPSVPIQTLTVAQATAYYREAYWRPLYSDISDQALASKIFDIGVLFGIGVAVKNVQKLLHLVADGVFGIETLAAVNGINPADLLQHYKDAMAVHARNIASYNHEDIFLAGWLRRISS